jgi:phosphoribosylanthranilate isomerase
VTLAKICGLCSAQDAAMSEGAGAAYLGVILAPGRTRSRTIAEAQVIFEGTTSQRVGVFVDAATEEMVDAVKALGLNVLQLHGDESPAQVGELQNATNVAIWKAVRVRSADDVLAAARRYVGVDALLLDGWVEHAHGGAGARFDWNAVTQVRGMLAPSLQLVVAGGLTPANVATVAALLTPDVVDVSSGVETVPGRKDTGLVRDFIAAARGVGTG